MTVCRFCQQPVLVATMRRGARIIQLDPEPRALGSIAVDELGFASFIPEAARFPKHPDYVPPDRRFVSHRASCPAHEHTLPARRKLEVVR